MAVHAKPADITAVRWSQGITSRNHVTHETYSSVFLLQILRQDELTKEGRLKWQLWALRPAVSGTRDDAGWPKVAAVGAQQAISDSFFGFIQMCGTVSTDAEHLWVAEVKGHTKINEVHQRRPKWRQFK